MAAMVAAILMQNENMARSVRGMFEHDLSIDDTKEEIRVTGRKCLDLSLIGGLHEEA